MATLDVRAQNPGLSDLDIKEVHSYGVGLQSLSSIVGLGSFTNLVSLSLHGNQISTIEGLESLPILEDLNLSSNCIKRMEGLSHLSKLKTLDLSSNLIKEIQGLEGLTSLVKLALSHNCIEKLRGLAVQDGPGFALEYLDLRGNKINSLSELWFLARCISMQELSFCGRQSNPICQEPAYVPTILSVLPHLQLLDGRLLLPSGYSGSDNYSRLVSMYSNRSIAPVKINAEQLFGSLCRRSVSFGLEKQMLPGCMPKQVKMGERVLQHNWNESRLWSQSLTSPPTAKVSCTSVQHVTVLKNMLVVLHQR